MKAYCEHCDNLVPYRQTEALDERVIVRDIEVVTSQKHAYCEICGCEVAPHTVIDYNVIHAHDAYRKAIGSVTATEIRALLEKYNIGAQPLSILLGWGENTIERQMKHSVPDCAHAAILRDLMNPLSMKLLLYKNGGAIADCAREKALRAVDKYLTSIKWKPIINPRNSQRRNIYVN